MIILMFLRIIISIRTYSIMIVTLFHQMTTRKKSRRARARFSGTGDNVEEEQEQMLSLEALEENE